MRNDVCIDSCMSQRMALLPRMKNAGMGTYCSVQVQEVTDGGVKFTDKDGKEQYIEAELVLHCCGSRSNDDIVKSLEGCCPWFVVTGDAKQARTVKMATYEGFCAAMDIL